MWFEIRSNPAAILSASRACSEPMIPGTKRERVGQRMKLYYIAVLPTPRTPPSEQEVTVEGGGGEGNRQR